MHVLLSCAAWTALPAQRNAEEQPNVPQDKWRVQARQRAPLLQEAARKRNPLRCRHCKAPSWSRSAFSWRRTSWMRSLCLLRMRTRCVQFCMMSITCAKTMSAVFAQPLHSLTSHIHIFIYVHECHQVFLCSEKDSLLASLHVFEMCSRFMMLLCVVCSLRPRLIFARFDALPPFCRTSLVQSEYVAEHDKRRQFVSGFTGSAGTAVITAKEALLWTDGRYHLQGIVSVCSVKYAMSTTHWWSLSVCHANAWHVHVRVFICSPLN